MVELTALPDLPIHVSHALRVSIHLSIPLFVDCACWHGNNARIQNVSDTCITKIPPLTFLHAGTGCDWHNYGIDTGSGTGGSSGSGSCSTVPILKIPLPKQSALFLEVPIGIYGHWGAESGECGGGGGAVGEGELGDWGFRGEGQEAMDFLARVGCEDFELRDVNLG